MPLAGGMVDRVRERAILAPGFCVEREISPTKVDGKVPSSPATAAAADVGSAETRQTKG